MAHPIADGVAVIVRRATGGHFPNLENSRIRKSAAPMGLVPAQMATTQHVAPRMQGRSAAEGVMDPALADFNERGAGSGPISPLPPDDGESQMHNQECLRMAA